MNLPKHWTEQHIIELENAKNFARVAEIAISVLEMMPSPIFEVCGPISTGAYGYENNLKIFEGCILKLDSFGFSVFNLIPLRLSFDRLINEWINSGNNEYCKPILEIVYRNIFESTLVECAFFLPNWQTSFGARWERKTLSSLKIPILEYPIGWHSSVLKDLEIKNSEVVV